MESLKLGGKLIMWSKRQIVESALWIFVIYLSNFNVDGEKLIPCNKTNKNQPSDQRGNSQCTVFIFLS